MDKKDLNNSYIAVDCGYKFFGLFATSTSKQLDKTKRLFIKNGEYEINMIEYLLVSI